MPATPLPRSSATPATLSPSTRPSSAFRFAHPLWFVSILSGLSLLFLAAAYPSGYPPPLTPLQPVHSLAYAIFRTQSVVVVASLAAIAAHAGEAVYVAVHLLDERGVRGYDRLWWTLQTLILGFPSLRLLLRCPSVHRRTAQ